MNRDDFIEYIIKAIYEIEPNAEIILYGSQARGNASSESDWDFLILVDGHVDDERTDRIRHRLYEIEWDSGEVLSSIIRNREEWNSYPNKSTPFYRNVTLQGRIL